MIKPERDDNTGKMALIIRLYSARSRSSSNNCYSASPYYKSWLKDLRIMLIGRLFK